MGYFHKHCTILIVAAIMLFSTTRVYCAYQNDSIRNPIASYDISEQEFIELAKHDQMAFFKLALKRYEKTVKDYTGTFYKQERIKGKLGKKETIAFKFKQAPYSVYMQWEENANGAEKLLYVKGQNDGKMIVQPTGMFSWIKSVRRDPDCKAARKTSRYTCDEFGFYHTMKRVLKSYELANTRGDLDIKYIGPVKVHGRNCVAFQAVLAKKSQYPSARVIIKFDVEYVLPVGLELYDSDDKLCFKSSFGDLKFNVGLKDHDFAPKVCGL